MKERVKTDSILAQRNATWIKQGSIWIILSSYQSLTLIEHLQLWDQQVQLQRVYRWSKTAFNPLWSTTNNPSFPVVWSRPRQQSVSWMDSIYLPLLIFWLMLLRFLIVSPSSACVFLLHLPQPLSFPPSLYFFTSTECKYSTPAKLYLRGC